MDAGEVVPLVHNPGVIFCAYCVLESTTTADGCQQCAEGFARLVAVCIRKNWLDLSIRQPPIDSQVALQQESTLVEQTSDVHGAPGSRPELPRYLAIVFPFFYNNANDFLRKLCVIYLEKFHTTRAGKLSSCQPPQGFEPWFKVDKRLCS